MGTPMGTIRRSELVPLNGRGVKITGKFDANVTLLAGQPVALITGTGVDQQQTLTGSGSPASGSTIWQVGAERFTVPYNATAAQVKTALLALSMFITGDIDTSGGALNGTPIIITFQGRYAGLTIPIITQISSSLDTGSVAATISRAAVANGRYVAADWTKIADPAYNISAVSATGSDGTIPAGAYTIQFTWDTAAGETLASPAVGLLVASTNHIVIGAVSAGNTPNDAVNLNVYINGCLELQIQTNSGSPAGASGSVAATNITALSTTLKRTLPTISRAFTALNGAHLVAGFIEKDTTTNYLGEPLLGGGPIVAADPNGGTIYFGGAFVLGSLFTITANNYLTLLDQIPGIRLMGTGWSSATAVVFIPPISEAI